MIISAKKYACETCIKGHRSSSCKHTDRPLFEIKKKGRPITQCEHCRELRKTKQVHVKCICESKFESTQQQGPQPGFDRAAFPNGLPPALGTSVAFPNPGDGTSSDSDHGGVFHSLQCKSGDPCNCVTPRTKPRPSDGSSETDRGSSRRSNPGHASSSRGSTSLQILARIQELRPLVPRPPSQPSRSLAVHDPSLSIPHGHPTSRHHGNSAPYGRVQGMSAHSNTHPQSYLPSPGSSNLAFSYDDQMYNQTFPAMGGWLPGAENDGNSSNLALPSMCGCGDDCACPGCAQHSRVSIPPSSAYASCANPTFCGTCMDCTIMALPSTAVVPPDTSLSIYDSSEAIDVWLRQMSASDPSALNNFPDYQQQSSWNSGGFYPDNGGRYNDFNPNDPMLYDANDASSKRGYPRHRAHMSLDESLNIDPRLLPGAHRAFLDVPGSDTSRSRSPSTSSQSSHRGLPTDNKQGAAYRPGGRMPGMYEVNASHAPPQLNVNLRPSLVRGPSSGSPSSGGSAGAQGPGRSPYGGSPSSSGPQGAEGEYGPSLAGLHIY